MRFGHWTSILVGVTAGLVLAGCGRNAPTHPDQSSRQKELRQIWEAYTSYVAENKRPPHQYEHLRGLGTVFPEGMRALKGGACVAIWDVADVTGAAADKILAYEKGAPEQGGFVVFGNGTVKYLTADEFRAAPKARD